MKWGTRFDYNLRLSNQKATMIELLSVATAISLRTHEGTPPVHTRSKAGYKCGFALAATRILVR